LELKVIPQQGKTPRRHDKKVIPKALTCLRPSDYKGVSLSEPTEKAKGNKKLKRQPKIQP
jgi:hypothetical protein